MRLISSTLLWAAIVGTVLVLADDLLSLYKVVEFREAIFGGMEFLSVVALFVTLGISALLVLISLVASSLNIAQVIRIARPCLLMAAGIAALVLLLNMGQKSEWLARALEGKMISALWCLVVPILFAAFPVAANRAKNDARR